ncbi:MAG TPA: hypothetical protein GX005_02205 [Bacteroidales bacterium]|nr:hypothetical protein [Bacteroidales bacterium]
MDNEVKTPINEEISNKQEDKIDIKPIKSIVKDKTSRKLSKGLKDKPKKPSWWLRTKRKKLVLELQSALREFGINKAWVHNHFITAEEKKSKNITIYVEINNLRINKIDAQQIDVLMDKKFKKKKISIIDVNTLQPLIKEFVFKDVTPLL